jgi:aminoglycoside phosphotransferase (APT) family kinase protein
MADTASPRSDLPPVAGADRRPALARFLAEASGADACEIIALTALSGGSIQENWGLDARFTGGPLDGVQRLVLRAAAATGVPTSLDRLQEFAVLKAAFAAGVTVPEPLFACAEPLVFGKQFLVMRRAPGTAAAHRITRDRALAPALSAIAERLGQELARIHRIRPPRPDLAFLAPAEETGPLPQIVGFRGYLDSHPLPRPVLEWGIRWLETHLPPPAPPVLCHHDFRSGNYLLDGIRLTGILDWEFAGWGDPHEDIGWFCSKGWRFARLDREAGGIADRASFYGGYESESGRVIDPLRVRFWEVLASVRWAVIALQQSDRHRLGGERSLDLALTGRRAGECELEILMLLDPARAAEESAACRLGAGESGARGWRTADAQGLAPMRDLPRGPALLAVARDVLLNDLAPLLPAERRLDALLVANCMAIAEREAAADVAPAEASIRELELLSAPLTPALSLLGGEREGPAQPEGEGLAGGDRHIGPADLLRCFARELRIGAFENSPEREARSRAMLWRLTIAKLRLANPKFLAANGFA